ncbi:Ubiquitin-conjugating enzyme [Carpediemonas membranifera]|uniref:Ubiquitin-conjugating enzyme n=1 Tax=Carpediemonas membranifera TaxID=201153 RepID=A0A8J6ASC5_9EUKA|nr:Ubiquitin-conjugating enzyme [Carpediemonas membranifera]|eukprot:KAG9391100.1 Ubiquitin-conjugating enzyme [Carpediemonas membranifera]
MGEDSQMHSRNETMSRIMRDLMKMHSDSPPGISAAPVSDDIMHWQAIILGPEDTPWENGIFELTVDFPDDYPHKPPRFKFVTNMYHPNIYVDGSICLDILQTNWSSVYDISAVLNSIRSLLTDPNPNSPANVEAARLFVTDKDAYEQQVFRCVQLSLA